MSYLITGATGFVGSTIARRLAAEGADVHVLARPGADLARLGEYASRVRVHAGDFRDPAGLPAVMRAAKPKIVYHCAAHAAYAEMQDDVVTIAQANVVGSVALLAAAAETGVECFVNTGSSGEYGPRGEPLREDMALAPLNAYGASKAAATMFCSAMARRDNLPAVTLRLFSPYGPRDDLRRFIPKLIERCLAGEDVPLATGAEARDYFFVDDLVDLYLAMPKLEWRPGEVFNVGSGRQSTLREVVDIVAGLTETSSNLLWGHFPPRNFDTDLWVADTAKCRQVLGWSAATDLRTGLERTVAWHRQALASGKGQG